MTAVLEERLVLRGEDPRKPFVHGDFYVAAYQRGYRWGETEVRQLLDDIRSSPDDREYHLQPIVVLKRDDGSWELVDGQQRLTTLYLIVKYIRTHLRSASVEYRVTYETRPRSREYLETLDPDRADENVDFLHMSRAYDVISAWFEDPDHGETRASADDMFRALSRRVQVIWYEAPAETTEPGALFQRLNRDRIALTDAELIKALVLSKGAEGERGRDRQHEIAAQWDGFERELRNPQLWAFATGSSATRPTHIDFLFECLTEGTQHDRGTTYRTFEEVRERIVRDDSAMPFWRDVVELMGTLTGWFHDRELYHRIGYLIATGERIECLLAVSRGATHSEFREHLTTRIRDRLGLDKERLSLLRYGEKSPLCEQVLLLMNVESVMRSADPDSRFSFASFARGGWSLEHIHAQNSESLKTDQDRIRWIEDHLREIGSTRWTPDTEGAAREIEGDLVQLLEAKVATRDDSRFQQLVTRVFDLFSSFSADRADEEIHGLGNLALLQRDFNSKLNNAVFAVKRDRIVALDQAGAYILPCTRNVFLKYYTSAGEQHLAFWGSGDQEAYYRVMLEMIEPYLEPERMEIAE